MDQHKHSRSRREWLSRVFAVSGAIAGLSLVTARSARAGKAEKSDFFYQDHPKNGKSCSSCALFTMGENGRGTCGVVEGEINANGWCMAFSQRK